MKTLAIIGTAGRKEDGLKLTRNHWEKMCAAARKVIEIENIEKLVSGGAAWADHVAIAIQEEYRMPMDLWLPANQADLDIAQWYHKAFTKALGGGNTWLQVLASGADEYRLGGFKDRNTKVAEAAHCYLAMTFGHGSQVKDGGTLDTVLKMRARNVPGYHLDLNTLTLYRCKP